MKIFALENVIGYTFTARVSPAEVIAIYGPGIGPATAGIGHAPPTASIQPRSAASKSASTASTFLCSTCPPNQINAVVPMELSINTSATFQVTNGTAVSPEYPAWIVATSTETFATVINQDGTLNSQSNPAPGGSIVSLFATAWQSNFAPLADGQVATAMRDACLGACTASASMGSIGPPTGLLRIPVCERRE